MANTATSRAASEKPVIDVARPEDAPAIKTIVDAAYSKYIEPMGMIPAAMKVQYDQIIGKQEVYVLREGGEVLGSVILGREGDAVTVRNLVVAPSQQGRGFGRLLMKCAEDKAAEERLPAVQLFANEKMYDNLTLYPRLGFVETGRKTEEGFNRIYFRKNLF